MIVTKIKYHPIVITLLFCIMQIAGIDAFCQQIQKAPSKESSLETELPKARQRRDHKGRIINSDSIINQKVINNADSIVRNIEDSIATLLDDNFLMVDSIEKANSEQIKQIEEAITIPQIKDTIAPVTTKPIWIPNPTKATWLAVVFPGGGQIYNRKYWKLPIIYGGFAGCAYALTWNGKMYKDYSQAYLDIMDNDPNTNSHLDLLPNRVSNYSEAQLKSLIKKRKDTFRRYRDLSIFAVIGVYLISIVDAYVDAELSNFDITPDLSMRVEPVIMNTQTNSSNKSVGVQCSFRF